MKNFLKLAAIACVAVFFVSCEAKDDKALVKDVVESYMQASASLDYAKLKTLVTPESVAAIEEAEQMLKSLPEEAKKMVQEAVKNIKLNTESIVIDGNVATATIVSMDEETTISLEKVDGKWLMVETSPDYGYDEEW